MKDSIKDYVSIDPAFFQKFSELINNTIAQHRGKQLSDSEFLNKITNIRNEFKNDIPTLIAFYSFLQNQTDQNQRETVFKIALNTYDIIKQEKVVHWTKNTNVLKKMGSKLDNYFF